MEIRDFACWSFTLGGFLNEGPKLRMLGRLLTRPESTQGTGTASRGFRGLDSDDFQLLKNHPKKKNTVQR